MLYKKSTSSSQLSTGLVSHLASQIQHKKYCHKLTANRSKYYVTQWLFAFCKYFVCQPSCAVLCFEPRGLFNFGCRERERERQRERERESEARWSLASWGGRMLSFRSIWQTCGCFSCLCFILLALPDSVDLCQLEMDLD